MTLERQLALAFLEEHPSEAALALERMDPDRCAALVREVRGQAASAVTAMTASASAACLSRLQPDEAAPVLDRLEIHAAIALMRHLPADTVERLLSGLPESKQEVLRRALRHLEGTAGALMDPAVLALPDDVTVAEARLRLRRARGSFMLYLYVVDRDGRLVGVLDVPELMRAGAREPIRAVMHGRVEQLEAWMPAAAVRMHAGWRSYHAMPVADEQGRLVGVIRYQTLRRLERDAELERDAQPGNPAVAALGELFHIGVAGLVEGVVAAAAARHGAAARAHTTEGAAR